MSKTNKGVITGYFLRSSTGEVEETTQNMAKNDQQSGTMSVNRDLPAVSGDNTAQATVSTAELKMLIIGMERRITSRLDTMDTELKSIKSDQMKMEAQIQGLEHDMQNTKSNVDSIEKKKLKELNDKMDNRPQELNDKLTKMEIHDRRMNLLFYGVEEKPNENLDQVIHDFFMSDFGVSEAHYADIVIINAHRLPRRTPRPGPNPVIIRFGYMSEVQHFLNFAKQRPYNKDKRPVMVYTDLPQELKQIRGRAVQEAKVLRQNGRQTRIRVVGTKIVLESRNRPRRGTPPGAWTTCDF